VRESFSRSAIIVSPPVLVLSLGEEHERLDSAPAKTTRSLGTNPDRVRSANEDGQLEVTLVGSVEGWACESLCVMVTSRT
jgi:hypothetical protein